MKKTKYLCSAFLVSSIIGFCLTHFLKSNPGTEVQTTDFSGNSVGMGGGSPQQSISSRGESTGTEVAVVGSKEKKDNPTQNEVNSGAQSTQIQLIPDVPIQTGNSYSLNVQCLGATNGTYHYELWGGKKCVAKSSNGHFKNIPGCASGHYKLCLVDNNTGKNLVAPQSINGFIQSETAVKETKQAISASEFQSRMLDRSDQTVNGSGKNSVISRAFKVKVVNMAEDEGKTPSDVQDVRDKISYGTWKSATVVGIEYDTNGLVKSITVSPVYPVN